MDLELKTKPSIVMNTHSLTNVHSKKFGCTGAKIRCFGLKKERYRSLSVEVKNTRTRKIKKIELQHNEPFGLEKKGVTVKMLTCST